MFYVSEKCNLIFIFLYHIYKNGDTPLTTSVFIDNFEMCKLLLEYGALPSINTPNNVCKYLIISNHI
jgi:hypothetical protein